MTDYISQRTLELSENKTEGDLSYDKHTIGETPKYFFKFRRSKKPLLSRYALFASEIWQSASENHHVHKSASSTHGPHLLALVLGHFEGYLRGEEASSLPEKHGGSSPWNRDWTAPSERCKQTSAWWVGSSRCPKPELFVVPNGISAWVWVWVFLYSMTSMCVLVYGCFNRALLCLPMPDCVLCIEPQECVYVVLKVLFNGFLSVYI